MVYTNLYVQDTDAYVLPRSIAHAHGNARFRSLEHGVDPPAMDPTPTNAACAPRAYNVARRTSNRPYNVWEQHGMGGDGKEGRTYTQGRGNGPRV